MASTHNVPILNKLSRAQAMDISIIDHELLKLLLPQIRSMFKYFDDGSMLHSVNAEAISGQYEYPSLMSLDQQQRRRQIQERQHHHHQQNLSQVYEPSSKYFTNIVLHLMKAVMIYSTLLRYDFPTPGMNNLKLTFKSRSWKERLAEDQRMNRNIYRKKVYRYIFLSTLLPLLHDLLKWKAVNYQSSINNNATNNLNATNINSNNDNNNGTHEYIRISRRLAVLQSILKLSSIIIPPLQIFAHIAHLMGNTASPELSMRLSNLQYDALPPEKSGQRSVNFSYAQRRIWYEEAMITCSMIVPIDMWREVPNIFSTYICRWVS